jgi:DNA-binding response OmpR family regulator
VLVAAQDVPLQAVFRDWLSLDGYEVTLTGSDRAAIEGVKEHGPYDLLVLDVDESRSPSYALVEQLRSMGVTTPVILVSLRLELSEAERSRLGVGGVLRRPLPLPELSAAVRRVLGRGGPMRSTA